MKWSTDINLNADILPVIEVDSKEVPRDLRYITVLDLKINKI